MAEPVRRRAQAQTAPPELPLRPRHAPTTSVPFLEPVLPPLEALFGDFERIYKSKTFSNGGPVEQELSARFSRYLGVAHCLPVANATLGLMIAIKALAKPGRTKVVLPSFTFAATALAAEWCGLTPVFCDVEPDGWQAHVTKEELAPIADDVALLLTCNTFGAPADIVHWKSLARALDVPLLIDSAPGLGATYADGKPQGTSGVMEVFSMHATKPFAIGEGGLITTDDPALAQALKQLRSFGFDEERICQSNGMNAKLTEMQCAIACRVLDVIDDICTHRRARAAEYRARLAPLGVDFQAGGECSAYQFMPVRVPLGADVPALRKALSTMGVDTRCYFATPLHLQPHFVSRPRLGALANTEALCPRMLSLPMSNKISPDAVSAVCDALELSLGRAS